MKKRILLSMLAAGCGMVSAPAQGINRTTLLNPGDHTRTVTSCGLERSYIVHIPKSCAGDSGPHPAVLVFHGGGSHAAQWMPFCGLNETADREGFITVYPDGTGKTVQDFKIFGWNGGPRRPGGGDAKQSAVDDVAFTAALLDDLAAAVKVDQKRVYAAGMSMGAIMVYRLASELSGRIAAIAAVAGPMGAEACKPERPVPVLHFHGTEDEAVPFNGGKGKLDPSQTDFLSVKHSITAWVKANGCAGEPKVEAMPDTVEDGTKVTRTVYGEGRAGAEVVLITIEGGGHTWPELKVLGRSTRDISANELMWEFFKKHPMGKENTGGPPSPQ